MKRIALLSLLMLFASCSQKEEQEIITTTEDVMKVVEDVEHVCNDTGHDRSTVHA